MSAETDAVPVRISVVIATYQAAHTLVEQFAALARQESRLTWEVLVCDNGSTDGTRELVEAWTGRLPRLRWVDASARRGAGAARNAGARLARGEWLVFCDADDVVAPGWLDAVARALAEHSFVAGRFGTDELNDPWTLAARSLQQQDGLQNSPFPPHLPHAGAGNMGVHRSAFLAVGGFDPGALHLEDTDLSWRLQLAGHPLVFVPEAVVHVRLRSTFRNLYRQGFDYGAAEAWLEQRYRDVPPDPADVPPPGPGGGSGAATMLRKLAAVRDRGSLGHFLWQMGWHVGHRRKPHVAPAPLRPVSPSLPTS
ncbi:glycosyltransferase family 2 protein [Kineococcus sp. G2]|uniref:glycosyltransferase family 2 protein n=1 Tax=Kineococcus sp. G2 TaxID=3127484 RepID=UPI00301E40E9